VSGSGELNGELNGALNGELNEALKGLSSSVKATYEIIRSNPSIQRKDIIGITKLGSSTIDRHLAVLIERKLVVHKDSKKTGGYYPLVTK
jgi:DNA-binding MarR family transcriptional regulator